MTKDVVTLFAFIGYPTAHWIHLRTTKAIESTLATVKARTWMTKGVGLRHADVAIAFKLLTQAERHWRWVNSPHLVAFAVASDKFPDDKTRILPDLPPDSIVNLQVDAILEPATYNS